MTTTQHPNSTASASSSSKAAEKRTVRFRIERRSGPNKPARWEAFDVPILAGEGANVISCLQYIARQPITTDGKETDPVVWDSGCLEEVCGACTMIINGQVRQSCSCLIDNEAPNDGDVISLQPMSKFPVVRDLWVDRERMFHNLKRAHAWTPIDGLHDRGAGPQETAKNQETRYIFSTCMTCGCCLEACPQFLLVDESAKWDESFVGANTIGQVRLFNLHPTAKVEAGERLEVLMGPGGISDCGNAQNCVKVCPKDIPLTEGIAAMGRAVTVQAVKQFFAGE